MDYAKYIAALESARLEKHERMKELRQKAMDEGRSLDTAEAEETDTLADEIKTIDEDLKRTRKLKAIEDEMGAKADPIDDKVNKSLPVAPGKTVAAVPKNTQKLEKGLGFARYARVKGIAFKERMDPLQIAKSIYPDDETLILSLTTKASVAAANTGDANWAGNLVLDGGAYFADFVEYLRERSVVGQVSDRLRRLPFDTQVLVQTSGGKAQWVAEGDAKPLTKWKYTRAKLEPLKVASIAAATEEQLRRASASTEILIRDELTRAVNAAVDGTFISNDQGQTGESPDGLRYGTGALPLNGDGTVAGVRCDIKAFLKAMVSNNLSVSGAFWLMSEGTATDLQMATNEVGASAFNGIGPEGGVLAGLPVFTSQYIADESDGAVVMLVKGDEIFLGDEGGINMKASDQASLVMADDPTMNSTTPTAAQLVSMWQTNSVAFLCERIIAWQKRRAQAVVWGYVNWDECSS